MTTTASATEEQPHPTGLRLVPTVEPGPGPAGAAPDRDHTPNDPPSEITILQCRLATMPAIEQAKGALMAIYGLTDQAAFDLLRWHSQQHNIKLRDLAARLTTALSRGDIGTPATTRMDRLLDTITSKGSTTSLAKPITRPGTPKDHRTPERTRPAVMSFLPTRAESLPRRGRVMPSGTP